MRFTLAWFGVAFLSCLIGCGGATKLECEPTRLPSPTPTYGDTLIGLVLTPTRASMRDASERERKALTALTADAQRACADDASPADAADCDLAKLRADLTSLAAPDHPTLFTEVDAALDPALSFAHGEVDVAARDCGSRSETTCDAWLVARAFGRALCDLNETEGA